MTVQQAQPCCAQAGALPHSAAPLIHRHKMGLRPGFPACLENSNCCSFSSCNVGSWNGAAAPAASVAKRTQSGCDLYKAAKVRSGTGATDHSTDHFPYSEVIQCRPAALQLLMSCTSAGCRLRSADWARSSNHRMQNGAAAHPVILRDSNTSASVRNLPSRKITTCRACMHRLSLHADGNRVDLLHK